MKVAIWLTVILGSLLSLTSWISYGIWDGWWYPQKYEASLNLADDASLPGIKAQYLTEYLQAVNGIKGEPRLVFKRPNLNLSKQRDILRGLIERFEEIAKLSPSEMAYQQGMFQLTGQEMEHQLQEISGVFKSAKLRENLTLFFFWYWGWWLIPVFFGVMAIIFWNLAGH